MANLASKKISKRFIFAMSLCTISIAGITACNSSQPMPLLNLMGRGGVFIAIDLPPSSNSMPERIVIAHDPRGVSADRGPQIVVLPNGQRTRSMTFWLSEQQWRPADELREAWCENPPVFREIAADEVYYGVALDCPGFGQDQQLRVPVDDFPVELQKLVDAVSPNGD